MEAKEQISGDCVRNELMVAANAYQAFTRQVWEAIIECSKTVTPGYARTEVEVEIS